MSVSQHPIALRLEQQVGGATKLLATVMALPLVDGIFPAMILAGAVATWTGVVEVGLLIFGGSATVAVILADMEGTRREQITAVLTLGLFLIVINALMLMLADWLLGGLSIAGFGWALGGAAVMSLIGTLGEWVVRAL